MEKSTKILKEKSEFLKGQNFIIFGEDFARYPNPLEHLMRPLFKSNKFIWVETIGLRSPRFSLYDIKRIFEKISTWIGFKKSEAKETKIPKNIFVVSPFMLPFTRWQIIRLFNKWNVTRKTRKALATHKFKDPITLVSVPNACDFVGAFNEQLKVYFCTDEFSLWPGLNTQLVTQFEKKLIANVDLIIATSKRLTETKKVPGKKTPLLTHGVEFNHFNIGPKKLILEAIDAKIKLCYFGLFDERSNQEILFDIATSIPQCEIHILGNVVCNISKLSTVSNIFFHGKIDYHLLPKAICEMDIFLLPYVRNELTNNINPLKLKEYLLTGRPVIATDLPEVVEFDRFLFLGKDSKEFISIISKLHKQSSIHHSHEVIEYIKDHETWDAKAHLFSEIITSHL